MVQIGLGAAAGPNGKRGHTLTLSPSRGLARALWNESVVSDLIQHLSDLDFGPWKTLAGVKSGTVIREHLLPGGAGRADLVLLDENGHALALLEVKVAHSFDDAQRTKYEEWATGNKCETWLLTVEPQNYEVDGWRSVSLASVFSAWTESSDPGARSLAVQIVAILTRWEQALRQSMLPITDVDALPIASIQDPFTKRVLTRSMRNKLHQRDRLAYAGVSSGGGNALIQAWHPIEGQAEKTWFIAEARMEPEPKIRFGVETGNDNELGRQQIFDIAMLLDDAIRVDSLQKHLHNEGLGEMARALTAKNRPVSGRPAPGGDWSVAITSGKAGAGNRPGFHRDRATRLEAMATLDGEQITMHDLEVLLDAILTYLAGAWSSLSDPVLLFRGSQADA